ALSLRVADPPEDPIPSFLEPSIMNRLERSDVPFVPSQIAQPEGGSIVALPSASRLNAEGGGNQPITVLAGVSGAFAPDVAMIMTSALGLTAPRALCLHRTSANVMAITEWSIRFARPNLAEFPPQSYCAGRAAVAYSRFWHSAFDSLRCRISEAIGAKRTC